MKKRSKRSVRVKQPKLHPSSVRFDAARSPRSKIPENAERNRGKHLNTEHGTRNTKLKEPVELLKSAIAARRKSQTELSGLGKLLADKSARQAALETTGDLHDAAVLTEIARLQIFTALLPRRIAAKEEADLKAEQSLTDATNQFIREHLGPRVQRLAAQTRAIVEAELSSHYRDPAARIAAVCKSERLWTVESLAWSVSVAPPRGAVAHAEGAFQSFLGRRG